MTILAVDLGLRSGLALYDAGLLRAFRSQNFGTISRLKRAIPVVLHAFSATGPIDAVVVEGDRRLGELWQKDAERRMARFFFVAPEVWRASLLLPREQRSGVDAKEAASRKALELIEQSIAAGSGLKRPRTALVDDVAEAICIGAWAVDALGAPR